MFKKIWNDPVFSKVIAGLILVISPAAAWFVYSYFTEGYFASLLTKEIPSYWIVIIILGILILTILITAIYKKWRGGFPDETTPEMEELKLFNSLQEGQILWTWEIGDGLIDDFSVINITPYCSVHRPRLKLMDDGNYYICQGCENKVQKRALYGTTSEYNRAINRIQSTVDEKWRNIKQRPKRKSSIEPTIILVLMLLVVIGIFYLEAGKKFDNSVNRNFWLGDWTHTEVWGNKTIRKGTMTLRTPNLMSVNNKDSIIGISYNEKNEASLIKGIVTDSGNVFTGIWKSSVTEDTGTFHLELIQLNSFIGHYMIEENEKENRWEGEKFLSDYTHTLHNQQGGTLNLRTRGLTPDELNQDENSAKFKRIDSITNLCDLINGDSLKIIDEKKKWFELITICDGNLRRGYMSSRFGQHTKSDKKRIAVKKIHSSKTEGIRMDHISGCIVVIQTKKTLEEIKGGVKYFKRKIKGAQLKYTLHLYSDENNFYLALGGIVDIGKKEIILKEAQEKIRPDAWSFCGKNLNEYLLE